MSYSGQEDHTQKSYYIVMINLNEGVYLRDILDEKIHSTLLGCQKHYAGSFMHFHFI